MSTAVPHNGTATSREAAASIMPHRERLWFLVCTAIYRSGLDGLTCDEAEQRLGLSHQTCSARIRELAQAKLITPAGRRRTRSNRSAVVWVKK